MTSEFLTPTEFGRRRGWSKFKVYRYLASGMIPDAQQIAAGYAWRIPADAEVVVPAS
ncbi:hypothetical protein [Gordonia neofelifaecis]|uniref:Uncharacterized protein n=1 Tax=Gordonia neofelifaecis NRRL B-59395 TaxID=644548 RepID=F1YE79_9ACTN|nr:hypothetical protein [Gordonia neofelifaecis]EGD57169.1 hypothetical protein SCNU_02305 [Gordonia neofelifaecis NRRL B-59395]